MQICNLATVAVATTAGGTEVLSSAAATAAVQQGLMVAIIKPSVDIVLVDNGGSNISWANIPGSVVGTVANSPAVCPAGIPTIVYHRSGAIRAISTSGVATTQIALGMAP